MEQPLVFGWRTAILTVPMLIMVLTAAALTQPLVNRKANHWLAVLLIVLAGMCVPWAIGFAGFYDRYRWLTFAPFANSLAIAPLFFFYLHTLVRRSLPDKAWKHLAIPAAQFLFNLASFSLPLTIKNAWSDVVGPYYNTVVLLLFIGGAAYYGMRTVRLLRDYRAWLASQRSDDDRYAARWITRALGVAGIMLAVWLVFELWDRIEPLGYTGLMGLYIAIATFGTFLAIEGWRHAFLRFPHFQPGLSPEDVSASDPATGQRNWRVQGEQWAREIRETKLYRDPDLSVQNLAKHLGTNQTYLSRALNEGLGLNFSTFVNGLRSEDVAARLSDNSEGDILSIALHCGFNSKASFHRSFRARFGMTPSAYRAKAARDRESQIR